MRNGLTKGLVAGDRESRRFAMRMASGVSALLVAAAVALASVSPASAESHAGKHLLKVDKYNAHPLRVGNLSNHGGPVQNSPVMYIVFWGWASDPSGEQSYLTGFLSVVGGSS